MLWLLALIISSVGGVIVPEEVPSLLSIVYSNIPPIKKGTDSRVGFGFALGPHADFQVLFELGPQKDTQQTPMQFPHQIKRNQKERQTQKSQTKRKTPSNDNSNKNKNHNEGTEYLNSWSQRFKQNKPSVTSKPFQPLPIPEDSHDSVPAGSVDLKKIIQVMGLGTDGKVNQPKPSISPSTLNKLKQLYGQKPSEVEISSTIRPRFVPKKTTKKPSDLPPSYERLAQFALNDEKNNVKRKITEDLSDVSLDDE